VLVAAAGGVFGAPRFFNGRGGTASATRFGTSMATVTLRSLSSQQQVNGTLGYGKSTTVVAPVGTTQQALKQAQQQLSAAQTTLSADQVAAADAAANSRQLIAQDTVAVTTAQNQLASDQAAQSGDCSQPASQACSNDKQAVSKDNASLTAAENALAGAQLQAKQSEDQSSAKLDGDRLALQNAQSSLANAGAAAVNPGTTFTSLPTVGQTISQGEALYAVDGISVPLFYGAVTPWRAFQLGMSDGPDVGELTANLVALGFGNGLRRNDHFSSATRAAVERWQASIGAAQTGGVRLGDCHFEPGQVVVTDVTPVAGGPVQPGGPILKVASTARQVVVNLDAALQTDVRVGDPVVVTLPGNRTTPGTVSYVGSVATTSSGQGGSGASASGSPSGGAPGSPGSPTVEVDVRLADPSATGTLDQAPVQVSITTATVNNALVVPVSALLATSGGGDAVEVVTANGSHLLVPVTLGLFDDADGLVQVSGAGLAAGQRVVVPQV